jgi:hypothetical protein
MSELTEVPIAPPPGVIKTDSKAKSAGRWSDVINMRFVKDMPQKIGGWTKAFVTATMGTPRTLHAWRDTKFNQYVGVGTYIKLYVYDPTLAQNDVTPLRSSGTLGNNPFTTALGSNVVTVAHTTHGLFPGDLITLSGSSAVGGITPNVSEVPVDTIIDANTYTFLFTSNATSPPPAAAPPWPSVMRSRLASRSAPMAMAMVSAATASARIGTARTSSTVFIEPRVWSIDNFGNS